MEMPYCSEYLIRCMVRSPYYEWFRNKCHWKWGCKSI